MDRWVANVFRNGRTVAVIDRVTSQLDDAATHLLAVGCADPDQVDAAVRLRCLWAVEELRAIGAHARRDLEPHDVPGVLNAALAALDQVEAAPSTDAALAATVRAVVDRLRGT